MYKQFKIEIDTPGRGFINITDDVNHQIEKANVSIGLCHLFLHHTSASVVLCENADPLVQRDLEAFMQRLTPDGDALYQHVDEGPDDMPSHVRTMLTQSFLMLPITDGKLALGRWQNIYLWEHRIKPHHRRLTVIVQGE